MKSLVCVEPGKFEYREKENPVLTKGNAIIKIKRIGVCGTDLHAFEGTQPYFSYPRILGHELSGELIEPGEAEGFEKNEPVTFIPYFPCFECIACRSGKPNCCVNIQGAGVHIDGGMVEYLSVPVHSLIHGEGLNFEELALVEPLAIGAHAIRRAAITPGEFAVVIGAGPIGLGIMEFARIAGANVIAVDINDKRLAFCRDKLNINHTVNATSPEADETIRKITRGEWAPAVIDATGNLRAIQNGLNYLAHGGRYVLVGLQKEAFSFNHPDFHKRETTLMSSRNATRDDFEHVVNALKTGKVQALNYITHRVKFDRLKDEFPKWLKPESGVIKAMVEMN